MARDYRPVDREQEFLLPPSMVDWLPADHPVWFLIEAVEQLDTSAFHAKSRRGGVGRAGYDPDMVLTLFVYAMAQGVSSSRRMEQLCRTDVAFRVICAQDVPDHTVLARFRQAHQQALQGLLTATLELAAQLGMVRLGVVALDGTKIAANASPGANRREETLRKVAAEFVAGVAEADAREDALFGARCRGDELPSGVRDRSNRAGRIEAAIQQIEDQKRAEREVSETQRAKAAQFNREVAEGKVMQGGAPRGSDRVERARQTWQREWAKAEARVQDRQERVAQARAQGRRLSGPDPTPPERSSHVRRAREKYDRARAAQEQAAQEQEGDGGESEKGTSRGRSGKSLLANMTDPQSRTMKTRNGWIQGYNCQTAVSQDGFFLTARATTDANDLRQFIPTMHAINDLLERLNPHLAAPVAVGVLLADKGYDSDANLAADGPDRLIGLVRDEDQHCPEEDQQPPIPQDATPRERMRHRLSTQEGKDLYAHRSGIVEPGNSWLKDRRGLRRFARRGREAVESELAFACAVTNLLRIAALGVTAAQVRAS